MKFQLFIVLSITAVISKAQKDQPPTLNIGDPAPALKVRKWIKGYPVQTMEKGKVYVVEFWASWCKPCIGAMSHISSLAREYKDKVVFIGMDIYEKQSTSLEKITSFVDSMGERMDYRVGVQDSDFMSKSWLFASGEA